MDARQAAPRRSYWLKTLHQWHWISSALCLLGMLLFAFTGITLNHAADIEAKPDTQQRQAMLPEPLKAPLATLAQKAADDPKGDHPLPADVRDWVHQTLSVDVTGQETEWSPTDVYVSLPRPGGDAWLRIDFVEGELEYENTSRGWIAYLNDLHKGRHTGLAWKWFIDIFSVACLIFSLTGLLILKFHASNRPSTWPIVGLGVVIPVILALLFIH